MDISASNGSVACNSRGDKLQSTGDGFVVGSKVILERTSDRKGLIKIEAVSTTKLQIHKWSNSSWMTLNGGTFTGVVFDPATMSWSGKSTANWDGYGGMEIIGDGTSGFYMKSNNMPKDTSDPIKLI